MHKLNIKQEEDKLVREVELEDGVGGGEQLLGK